jgi:hypothetical protein
MDRALDRSHDTELTAIAFEALGPDERSQRLAHLVCPSCSAQAFFRRRSRDGRAPCFFSLEHADDCAEAGTGGRGQHSERRYWHEAIAAAEHIELAITSDDDAETTATESDTRAKRARRPRSRASSTQPSGGRRRKTRAGLVQLLEHLIGDPAFADSNARIVTDAGYTWRARNLLTRFADADPYEERDRPHLFFGPLAGASWDLNWLHTGPGRAVRVRAKPVREPVIKAAGFSHPGELAGVWAIAFGKCHQPEGNVPPYIELFRRRGERKPATAHLCLLTE